jgi:hypothetical protein
VEPPDQQPCAEERQRADREARRQLVGVPDRGAEQVEQRAGGDRGEPRPPPEPPRREADGNCVQEAEAELTALADDQVQDEDG